MMMDIISHVICSFLGTIGFAILFNIPSKYYLSGGLTGVAGWMMYMLLTAGFHVSSEMATFWGTFVVVLISRMLTVRLRCPITIFLIAGIIPLVPGASVYFTAYHLMTGELSLAVADGMTAVKLAFGDAAKDLCISSTKAIEGYSCLKKAAAACMEALPKPCP